jgi:hypothetical protein
MLNARGNRLIGVGLGVYLVVIGMLVGMVIDRMRFDGQRSAVLGRYEQALQEWQTYRIALEKATDGHDEQSSCR